MQDFKAQSEQDSGLTVSAGGGLPKIITLEITGLNEVLDRDYWIEDPYWGPSKNWQPAFPGSPLQIFRR